jgi:sortase A
MGLTRWRRWLAAALLLAGAAQGAEGGWILLKAGLAQFLLDRAWAATVATGEPVRPWPWADTWPVGRLSASRLGADAVVLAGASGEALAFGPGLVAGTTAPGGEGHVLIAGHRDTHFAFLARVREGDQLSLEDPTGRRRDYRVAGMRVVDSRDAVIPLDAGGPWLTLVACWPFDALDPGGPLRYVVSARPAPLAPDLTRAATGSPGPLQPFLSRPTTQSSTSAPTVAVTRDPISPPAAMPSALNR